MPSLLVLAKGSTTGVTLQSNAFWRLAIGATVTIKDDRELPWFSLILIYPSSVSQTGTGQIVLARMSVPIAANGAEMEKVTSVALSGGSFESDVLRTTEAFNMFKNDSRVKGDTVAVCAREAGEVLRAYWALRNWLDAGAKTEETIECGDYRIRAFS